jgi:quercetin dioxygenase-like cupin family protein
MKKTAHHIVSDGQKTRFESREVEFAPVEGVAPGGVFNAAALGESSVALVTFDPGFRCEFHNTDPPSWMFVMQGRIELELSDDVSRTLGPGDIVYFEDTDGQGHRSRVIGDEQVIVATAGYGG